MTKVRTIITIEKDLLEKARKYNLSISGFIDIKLREYLALIDQVSKKNKSECGYRDLNPGYWLGKPIS
jgi:hypothetical protein